MIREDVVSFGGNLNVEQGAVVRGTLVCVPILIVALAITIIGLSLVALVAMGLVAAWYVGWIAIGYGIGQRLVRLVRDSDGSAALAGLEQ